MRPQPAPPVVGPLAQGEHPEAVSVLCDSFHEYPVMRYVIGPPAEYADLRSTPADVGREYEARLRALVGFFVGARTSRGEPVLGVREGSNVVAVALVTLPGEHASPPELAAHRERLWKELGDRARQRYEAFATARHQLAVPCAHYHLNMIGVRRSHAGRGLARRLLDVVHAMSARDAESGGVTLTTEDANNVPLYEHFGYRIVDHVCIAPELESWGFFRADATPV